MKDGDSMFFTLTFSHIVEGQRVPLTNAEGEEITKVVDAPTKTAAMKDSTIQKFCADTGGDCRVKGVI